MIEKVYISSAVEDLKYEICKDRDHRFLDFVYASDLEELDIIKLHQPSLFSNKRTKVFMNMEEHKLDFLLSICDSIKIPVIWGFKTLASNTKLYKKLSVISEIEKSSTIDQMNSRKQFIYKLFDRYKIKNKHLFETVLAYSCDSKAILEAEIKKLSVAEKVVPSNKLELCLCSHKADNDIFLFIDYLLEGDIRLAYIYANKIESSVHTNVIKALLLKRLGYLIGLSLGSQSFSNSCINLPNFLIQKNRDLAQRYGKNKLMMLYDHVDRSLDLFLSQDQRFKTLTSIIRFTALQVK